MPVYSFPVNTDEFGSLKIGALFVRAKELGKMEAPTLLRKATDGTQSFGVPAILPTGGNVAYAHIFVNNNEDVVPLR